MTDDGFWVESQAPGQKLVHTVNRHLPDRGVEGSGFSIHKGRMKGDAHSCFQQDPQSRDNPLCACCQGLAIETDFGVDFLFQYSG